MKKQIPEEKAASIFVKSVFYGIEKDWHDISSQLKHILGDSLILDDLSQFYLSIAVIAIQMQTLPGLLQKEQASRMRMNILAEVSSLNRGMGSGTDLVEIILNHEKAWQKAIINNEQPQIGIGEILFDQFNCNKTLSFEGTSYRNPFVVDLLGMAPMAGCWWKEFLDRHKLINDSSMKGDTHT